MKAKPLGDPALESALAALSPDGISFFTLAHRPGAPESLRGILIHGSRAVAQMKANHGLGPVEALVLGRACLCAGLMASMLKDEGAVSLRIDGDGPAEGLSAEGRRGDDGRVMVRGRLFQNPIPFTGAPGSLATEALFGRGALTVTRFLNDAGKPFSGSVLLKGTGIASNLASYYMESEQTRTAIDAGIRFDREGRPVGAGALLLQALPGADPEFVAEVESSMPGLPPPGLWFSQGGARGDFVRGLFGRFGAAIVGEAGFSFACPCSRERFAGYLGSLDEASLRDLAEKGPWPVETLCHQCSSTYQFGQAEILAMLEARGL